MFNLKLIETETATFLQNTFCNSEIEELDLINTLPPQINQLFILLDPILTFAIFMKNVYFWDNENTIYMILWVNAFLFFPTTGILVLWLLILFRKEENHASSVRMQKIQVYDLLRILQNGIIFLNTTMLNAYICIQQRYEFAARVYFIKEAMTLFVFLSLPLKIDICILFNLLIFRHCPNPSQVWKLLKAIIQTWFGFTHAK